MRWIGYAPYEKFIKKLAVANPSVLFKTKSEPQEFVPVRAATAGRNTPERAASTFIGKIRYLPYSKMSFVHIGNGSYVYPMREQQLAAWLRSKSLGQHYNNYIKLK